MAILQGGVLFAGSGSLSQTLGATFHNRAIGSVFAGSGAVVAAHQQLHALYTDLTTGFSGAGYVYPYPALTQRQAGFITLAGAGTIAAALGRQWFSGAILAGAGAVPPIVAPIPQQFTSALLAAVGTFALVPTRMRHGPSLTLAGAAALRAAATMRNMHASALLGGAGVMVGNPVLPSLHVRALLAGQTGLTASAAYTYKAAARIAGAGAVKGDLYFFGEIVNAEALIGGAGGFDIYGLLFRERTLDNLIYISALIEGEGSYRPNIYIITGDPINEDIQENAGSELIYRSASGLEKALADVEGYRITSTYAELVRDQWDPYAISYRNLPYLAWAVGVNLWEEDWTEEFKRYWVANQWTYKSQRGSLLGISNFVAAVGGEVQHAIVPPALFYPEPHYSDEERASYVARFPQIRLYPYSPEPKLPWLCYLGNFPVSPETGEAQINKNGGYLPMYPTNYNAGSEYQRACTLYEPRTGEETPLTVRTIKQVDAPFETPYADQIILPIKGDTHYYMGQFGKWALPKDYDKGVSQEIRYQMNQNEIFLGNSPDVSTLMINIPRDGSLDVTEAKAIYTTINPGLKNINVDSDKVALVHQAYPAEFYCGQCLTGKFLPVSNAWRFMYEVWYLLDPERMPDYKKAYVFLGRARFGEPKYTAELKIKKFGQFPSFFLQTSGFMGGYMSPPDTSTIDKLRRAVTASMALRDTVYIDTRVRRVVEVSDSILCDGSHVVGQMIDSY